MLGKTCYQEFILDAKQIFALNTSFLIHYSWLLIF